MTVATVIYPEKTRKGPPNGQVREPRVPDVPEMQSQKVKALNAAPVGESRPVLEELGPLQPSSIAAAVRIPVESPTLVQAIKSLLPFRVILGKPFARLPEIWTTVDDSSDDPSG